MDKEVKKKDTVLEGIKEVPGYEPPRVVTYSGDELLKELGPAQACSPFGGAVIGC